MKANTELAEPSKGVWRFGLRVTTKVWVSTDPPACPENSSCPLSARHFKNVLQMCRKAYTAFPPSTIPAMLMKAQHSWDFQICYHCGEIKVGPCRLHCRIEHRALVISVMLVAECRRKRWVQCAGQVWKHTEVLGGWKEQVLLPGILLGLSKMSLMCIAVVGGDSERELVRKMEWSNATVWIYFHRYEESVPLGLCLCIYRWKLFMLKKLLFLRSPANTDHLGKHACFVWSNQSVFSPSLSYSGAVKIETA